MGELQQLRKKDDPPFRQTMKNSRSLANRSKSLIRNNLGLSKRCEFTLFRTFKETN